MTSSVYTPSTPTYSHHLLPDIHPNNPDIHPNNPDKNTIEPTNANAKFHIDFEE
jgi:hypothetical protein